MKKSYKAPRYVDGPLSATKNDISAAYRLLVLTYEVVNLPKAVARFRAENAE